MARRNKRTSYEQYQIYLNMMESNPVLTNGRATRYDDRLNDWKNTTRCKYRRIMLSPGAKLSLSPLETRALSIFGEVSDVGALVFDDSAEYLEEHIGQEEPVDNYADSREDPPPPKSIRIRPGKAKQVPAHLQFQVACFKYSNPGFEYSPPEL
ncbi:GL10574 [Drosophila persimilis]|uniref:GL10574 n=1 Tax=Drosophila persimilis TaxID=7234 RepID=B4GB71_DROPE|nr:GL10574 [Drosophila persimilis]